MTMIRSLVHCVLAVSAAAATFGCGPAPTTTAPAAAPAAVQEAMPRRGEILRNLSLPATVAAWQQVTLYAKVAGYLQTIAVDKGDDVAAGSLIAEIEVPEVVADIAKARAEVGVASLLSSRLKDARGKAPDLVTPQSADDAAARLSSAEAALARQQALLGFSKITAPFAGVVTARFVDAGAFVPAATTGSTAGNAAIVTLADFRKVRVKVAVPEADVPSVRNGQPVDITFDEFPGSTFHASVSRIAYGLDEATRTMLAEVDVDNPERKLRPGMYATARIGVELHRNALLVPAAAVVTEKTGRSVFVVDGESRARKKTVHVGFENHETVEIADGIDEAQPVILVGKQILADGQPVKRAESQ